MYISTRPCPTGWRHSPELSVEVARKAVACRVFPLYEVFDGEDWRISEMPDKEPVDSYLDIQGRFKVMRAGDQDGIPEKR